MQSFMLTFMLTVMNFQRSDKASSFNFIMRLHSPFTEEKKLKYRAQCQLHKILFNITKKLPEIPSNLITTKTINTPVNSHNAPLFVAIIFYICFATFSPANINLVFNSASMVVMCTVQFFQHFIADVTGYYRYSC